MDYRQHKSSGLSISAIGFGCWQMGLKWWPGTRQEDTTAAVACAIEEGINLYDTADVYGFGHSEKALAEALGNKSKNVIISSKAGLKWDDRGRVTHNLSKQHILKAADDSLKRLRRDHIDIYFAHWPDDRTPIADTMEAFNLLKQAGKIRFTGLSNFDKQRISEARKYDKIHFIQPPYNLLQRAYETETLPYCLEQDIGVFSYSSIGKGLLTGKFTKTSSFGKKDIRRFDELFSDENFSVNIEIIEKLKRFGDINGLSLLDMAIAWILKNKAVKSALVGIKKSSQLKEIIQASKTIINDPLYDDINRLVRN